MSEPTDGDTLVLLTDVQQTPQKRVREGTHVTFLYAREVDGRYYVSVPGKFGSMASTLLVHPHEVGPIK